MSENVIAGLEKVLAEKEATLRAILREERAARVQARHRNSVGLPGADFYWTDCDANVLLQRAGAYAERIQAACADVQLVRDELTTWKAEAPAHV